MSFIALRSPPALRLRFLHSTLQACNHIDPPDPVSQLRPILNDDTRSSSLRRTNRTPHPYSLFEFDSTDPTSDYELQWTLHSQQLDAFNHEFWTDSNSRFEAGKAAALSRIPESSTILDSERALSEFYKQWLIQEEDRMDAYTKEWRRRNFENLVLAFRLEYKKIILRVSRIFKI